MNNLQNLPANFHELPKVLQDMITISPYIRSFSVDETGWSICDTEKVIWDDLNTAVFTFDKPDYIGDPIVDSLPIYHAMRQRKRIVEEVPKEMWGVNYICVAIPLYDEKNRVVGGLEIYQLTEKREKLLEIARSLETNMKIFDTTIQQIAAEAQELSATGQELNNVTEQTTAQVKESDRIVKTIGKIAKETNLIGLNAVIEAARSGAQGRSFSVVADEVRKLARTTSTATEDIDEILSRIQHSVGMITSAVHEVAGVADHQAAVLSEAAPALNELTALSNTLVELAENLTKDD